MSGAWVGGVTFGLLLVSTACDPAPVEASAGADAGAANEELDAATVLIGVVPVELPEGAAKRHVAEDQRYRAEAAHQRKRRSGSTMAKTQGATKAKEN